MQIRSITLAIAMATTSAGGLLASSAALAQAKQQFFPVLSGRTGPVAPNATPWANGHNDYMKLVNARGGINGVMTLVEECETARRRRVIPTAAPRPAARRRACHPRRPPGAPRRDAQRGGAPAQRAGGRAVHRGLAARGRLCARGFGHGQLILTRGSMTP